MIEIKRDVSGRMESSQHWLLNGNSSSSENNQLIVTAKDYTIPRRRQPKRTSAMNEGVARKNEEALAESFALTQLATSTTQFDSTKFTFNDASGNPVNYDENAVYLSFHHSVYETTIYEEFKKLGSKLKCGDVRANAALQRLKNGGDKKCFKLSGRDRTFIQVDEQAALESEFFFHLTHAQFKHSLTSFGEYLSFQKSRRIWVDLTVGMVKGKSLGEEKSKYRIGRTIHQTMPTAHLVH